MQTAHEVVPVEGVVEDMVPVQQTAPRSQAMVTTPPAMLALAIEKGAGMETLERLMALQERWDANEARKAYVAAMAAFKAEPMEILKRKLVEFKTRDGDVTSYHHAELSDVTDTVVPLMGKHGLSHRWDITQKGNEITVSCAITHQLGHSEAVSMTAMPDASGKKNAIQQVASTVTYLQRYTLLALTGMATKGMDDDGRTAEEILPEDQPDPEVQAARRKAVHDQAYGRHSESIDFIKERIASEDWKAVAEEWRAIPQVDQLALWLAPTKGGCFTTAERDAMKTKLPKENQQ
jgi:hypothetical protein